MLCNFHANLLQFLPTQSIFELLKHQQTLRQGDTPLLSDTAAVNSTHTSIVDTHGLRVTTLYGEYALPKGMQADCSDYIRCVCFRCGVYLSMMFLWCILSSSAHPSSATIILFYLLLCIYVPHLLTVSAVPSATCRPRFLTTLRDSAACPNTPILLFPTSRSPSTHQNPSCTMRKIVKVPRIPPWI